jgi:hypothetical protein
MVRLDESAYSVEPYEGGFVEELPRILNSNEVLLPGSEHMKVRMKYGEELPDLKDYHFDTSDLIAYSGKRRGCVKIILTVNNKGEITENGRRDLELINPHTGWIYEGVALPDFLYDELEGEEIMIEDLDGIGRGLTKDEISSNRFWRILARHPDEVSSEFAEDPNLLGEYFDWVASKTRKAENMPIYTDSSSRKTKLNNIVLGSVKDMNSAAVGDTRIGYDYLTKRILRA